MAPGGNNDSHAAVGIARLQSDLEHLSYSIDRIGSLVIDSGEDSLAMRVVLLERGLTDLRSDMDERLSGITAKLTEIRTLVDNIPTKPVVSSNTENALVESNKALVETNKALSGTQMEAVKGKWAVILALASGLTGAVGATIAAWLKAKFGG